jgi:hypothetical protein
MGVNISKSKKESKPKYDEDLIVADLSVSSCSLGTKDALDVGSCTKITKVKVVATGVDVNRTETHKSIDSGKNKTYTQQTVIPGYISETETRPECTRITYTNRQQNSNAEKRLHVYEDEEGRSPRENTEKKPSIKDTSKNTIQSKENIPVPSRQTKPHGLMKNDDILEVRRTDVFTQERLADKSSKTLSSISSKRPGQQDILYELGKEGIVKPMTEEQRTIGELRKIGILQETTDLEECSIRRATSRLAPLMIECAWANVSESELKAPWETKEPLLPTSTNVRRITPENYIPMMKTENEKTGNDEMKLLDVESDESTNALINVNDLILH